MSAETKIFQHVVYAEALTSPGWKKYFSILTDAGITSIEEFLAIPDEGWDILEITSMPKKRLQLLKQRLTSMQQRRSNSFSQPFQQNEIFDHFEFVTQFMCEQYFSNVPINDIASQLEKATTTVVKSGYDGITEHEAIMIALYCQEVTDQTKSFYYLINKCLRERHQNLIGLRSAIYLIDSALRTLPKISAITWRGMNVAPDETKFITGKEVCFSGICSTSEDKNQTLQFMEVPPHSGVHRRTLFKIHMKNGVSIQKWSCLKHESEVVASFCSRWKVLSIGKDQDELFDGIGKYHCDYIIELEQVEGESLFQNHDSPTGLHLLSKINLVDQSDKLKKDFKTKFISFFKQLTDPIAKSSLEKFLAHDWSKETQTFQVTCGDDETVFNNLTQFLKGINNLLDEFEDQNFNIKESFRICERNNIYSERQLLWCPDESERTVEQLCHMGFSTECAKKLFDQEALKEKLDTFYKSSTLDLRGTAENPQNVSRWLSDLRFNHCIRRGGILIGYYDLGKCMISNTKIMSPNMSKLVSKTFYQLDLFRLPNSMMVSCQIQSPELIIGAVIFSIQFGAMCLQLYHGDITFKQFLKSSISSAGTILAGGIGASIGSSFATALMMYFGFLGWPVTVAATSGVIVGGFLFGMTFTMLYQKLSDTLAHDGGEEEVNALRKLYFAALQTLNCTPNSTITTIKRAYYQLALATHPDRFDNKQSAKEEFQKVAAAYEIAKTYHEVLENAFKKLGISNNISIESLKAWAENNPCYDENKKAFTVIYRHVAYSSDNMKWLRGIMDSDRQLKLKDSKAVSVIPK